LRPQILGSGFEVLFSSSKLGRLQILQICEVTFVEFEDPIYRFCEITFVEFEDPIHRILGSYFGESGEPWFLNCRILGSYFGESGEP